MQDRERFFALPQIADTQQHSTYPKNQPPPNPPPPGTGACASITSSGGTLKVSLH